MIAGPGPAAGLGGTAPPTGLGGRLTSGGSPAAGLPGAALFPGPAVGWPLGGNTAHLLLGQQGPLMQVMPQYFSLLPHVPCGRGRSGAAPGAAALNRRRAALAVQPCIGWRQLAAGGSAHPFGAAVLGVPAKLAVAAGAAGKLGLAAPSWLAAAARHLAPASACRGSARGVRAAGCRACVSMHPSRCCPRRAQNAARGRGRAPSGGPHLRRRRRVAPAGGAGGARPAGAASWPLPPCKCESGGRPAGAEAREQQ